MAVNIQIALGQGNFTVDSTQESIVNYPLLPNVLNLDVENVVRKIDITPANGWKLDKVTLSGTIHEIDGTYGDITIDEFDVKVTPELGHQTTKVTTGNFNDYLDWYFDRPVTPTRDGYQVLCYNYPWDPDLKWNGYLYDKMTSHWYPSSAASYDTKYEADWNLKIFFKLDGLPHGLIYSPSRNKLIYDTATNKLMYYP